MFTASGVRRPASLPCGLNAPDHVPAYRVPMSDFGGDPACFLASTCLACGRFLEPVDLDEGVCPRCGEPVDDSSDTP